MVNPLAGQLGGAPFKYFGDWTDRVAKGELPASKPPRPQGLERNVVITTWEWGDPKKYLHDLISSDRRNPTVNGYGPLFGSPEYATDMLPILDPKTNKVSSFTAPVRDPGNAGIARARPRRHGKADDAIGLLGRREDLGHPGQQSQLHVRREGPAVARGNRARAQESGLLRQGLGPSVGQAVPAGAQHAPGGDARSQDDEIHVRRHLLRHTSPAVRLRQERHGVDQRRRTGRRLDQHQTV